MIKDLKQVDAGYSWDLNSRKNILWVSLSHHSSLQNVKVWHATLKARLRREMRVQERCHHRLVELSRSAATS